jgi:hypothetical protein
MTSCSLFRQDCRGLELEGSYEEPIERHGSIGGRVEFFRWLMPWRERWVRGGSLRDE